MLARGLKARKANDDGEEYEGLERAMEYAGVVGAELADMLTAVNEKVKAIEPRVPAQHTFRGDGLQNFIRDHQEELERLSHQVENLTTMTNEAVRRLQCYDFCSKFYQVRTPTFRCARLSFHIHHTSRRC